MTRTVLAVGRIPARTREYRITRFSSIEGNNRSGWTVWNEVTGLAQDTLYPTYEDAKAAALFVGEYYATVERGAF